MDLEYSLPFIILLFGTLSQFFSHNKLSFIYWFVIIFIILISGFRDKVGPDWPGYDFVYKYFSEGGNGVGLLSQSIGMELGFVLINYILAKLSFPLWMFYTFIAGTSIYLKSISISRYGGFTFLGIMLYFMPFFFFEEIIQIRQGLAVGITVFSLRYILERNLKMFLFLIFVGVNIHNSMLFFLPAYWLYHIKIPSYIMIVALIASYILSQLHVLSFFKPILSILPIDSWDKSLSYINIKDGNSSFSFADASRTIFVLILILFKKEMDTKDKYFNVLVNLIFFGSFFFYTFKQNPIFSARLTGYYSCFIYIAFPRLIWQLRFNKPYYILLYLGLILYAILLYYRFESIHIKTFKEYTNILYNPSKL